MKNIISSILLISILTFISSCSTAKSSATGGAAILDKNWKLVELNGIAIEPLEQYRKAPFMILNSSESRVNGSGGCNSFFGSYELQDNNGITFSAIGATKMACQDGVMQVESRFFQAFEMTKKFMVRDDTLTLMNSDDSPVARFVVIDN